jgi:hypothetical protein
MSGGRMILGDPKPEISVVTTKTLGKPISREQPTITEQIVIVDSDNVGNIVRHQETEVLKTKAIKVRGASNKMRRSYGSLYY